MCFYKDSSSCVECLFIIHMLCNSCTTNFYILNVSYFFLHFSSVMLSTERLSGQIGRTRLPRTSHLTRPTPRAHAPRASRSPSAPRASHRALLAPRLRSAAPRASRLNLRYAQPRSADRGRPPRRGIELFTGVDLRVNEPPLGGNK
jgi:hypothetical protein